MSDLFEADWIGSNTYFYNSNIKKISEKIGDTFQKDFTKLSKQGLTNYLKYGFSVFGQTPIDGVKYLLPNQKINIDSDEIIVENMKDPIEDYWDIKFSEDDVFELIKSHVQEWEKNLPPDIPIILPLSGGLDSRTLLWAIDNKERVLAYTYGVSHNQNESTEVQYAKELCKSLGIKWQQIKLGRFNEFIPSWDKTYGVSTHAHGMYQIEFYQQVYEKQNKGIVLSGIIGDAWAGSIGYKKIYNPSDLVKLAYNHGMHANCNYVNNKFKKPTELENEFFTEHKSELQNIRFQTVVSMRMKMLLLRYLLDVPRSFGFKTYSPFLNIKIAMAMLNINQNRRENRIWQREGLAKRGFDVAVKVKIKNNTNTLNFQGLIISPPPLLKQDSLQTIVDSNRVDWINKEIRKPLKARWNYFIWKRAPFWLYKLALKFGLDWMYRSKWKEAYMDYLVYYPLQNVQK